MNRASIVARANNSTGLLKCFHSDDRKYIDVKSLVPDVNNHDGTGSLTATILFSPPEQQDPRLDSDEDLDLDKDFLGFTPLNEACNDVAADIIAITGLGGHAFGSWAHSLQKIWLRDYLGKDIQNRARILIYGYQSQLQGTRVAKSILSDYSSSFVQDLMDIRNHPLSRDRPLILLGHSLGGLLIKQAITSLHPKILQRLPVRTVLFFGTPHKGLETEALETLVKGQPTQLLISELKHGSPTLDHLDDQFVDNVASNLNIYSYYESRPTKTVVKNEDGKWERSGVAKVMVDKTSACLRHPQESRKPIDGDHSQIAKLKPGQGGAYPNVLRVIKDGLQSTAEKFAAVQQEADHGPVISSTPSATDVTDFDDGGAENSNIRIDEELDEDEDLMEDDVEEDPNLEHCDKCEASFPKQQLHYHCIICDDGYYNLCKKCKKKGHLCPGRHTLYSRQLFDANQDSSDHSNVQQIALPDDFGSGDTHPHDSSSAKLSNRPLNPGKPSSRKASSNSIPLRNSSPSIQHRDTSVPDRGRPSILHHTSQNKANQGQKMKGSQEAKNPTITCRKCDRSFGSKNKLHEHLNKSGHEEGFIPSQLATSGPDELKQWKQQNANESAKNNDLQCSVCHRSFESRNKLYKHIGESGHGDTPASSAVGKAKKGKNEKANSLRCRVCGEAFESKATLFPHLREKGHEV